MKLSSRVCWIIAFTLGVFSAFLVSAFRGFLSIIATPILYVLNPWFLIFEFVPAFQRELIDPFDFLSGITILITKIKWVGSYEIIDFIGIPIIIILMQILFWRLLFFFSNRSYIDDRLKRKEKRILLFMSLAIFMIIFSVIAVAIVEANYIKQLKTNIINKTNNIFKLVLKNGNIDNCKSILISEPHSLEIQDLCYFIGAIVTRNISNCFNVIRDSDLCIDFIENLEKNQLNSKICDDLKGETDTKLHCYTYLGIYFQDKSLCNKSGYTSWKCNAYISS